MTPLMQVIVAAVTVGFPTLTVLVSFLINNQRLGEFERRVDQRFNVFEKRFDQRFNEQRELLRSKMFRMEQVLDARLKHFEEHLR